MKAFMSGKSKESEQLKLSGQMQSNATKCNPEMLEFEPKADANFGPANTYRTSQAP